MPYWANAPKTPSEIITSDENLQKLGNTKIMEDGSRIEFSDSLYFVGENQDSFVFLPTSFTNVKAAMAKEGQPAHQLSLIPSLIHFVRKDHKNGKYSKECTAKDKFFTEQLSRMMEAGKRYSGFIDTGIPQNAIAAISEPSNAASVDLLVGMYIKLTEIPEPSNLFSGLAVIESKGYGSSGGYSRGETETEKIAARQEAIKAILKNLTGLENPTFKDLKQEQWSEFITYCSFSLGVSLPSFPKIDSGYF